MTIQWRKKTTIWHAFPRPPFDSFLEKPLAEAFGSGGGRSMEWWVEWFILGLAFPIAIAGYFFPDMKSKPDDDEDR